MKPLRYRKELDDLKAMREASGSHRTQVLRVTGKARDVFGIASQLAKSNPTTTLGELAQHRNKCRRFLERILKGRR